MRLSCQARSSSLSKEKCINTQLCVWLPECVSVNSYKWLLTEQDAFCWQVSQCHQFNSLWALSSPSRLLSTHTSAQTKFTHTNTHVQQMHTPMYTHIHSDQPGLLSEKLVHHDWLSNPRTCANNFLSPGDKGEGRRRKKKKKLRGRWRGRYQLFIYMEHLFWGKQSKRKKKVLFPSVL